jgi:hypothetical protein
MAWIEQRGARTPVYRIRWSENGIRRPDCFATRADAEAYVRLVASAGGKRPTAATAALPPPLATQTLTAPRRRPVGGRTVSFAEWARPAGERAVRN